MPRQMRIEFEGAIYHVMNRGDRREPIFRDEADHERFLETLGEAAEAGATVAGLQVEQLSGIPQTAEPALAVAAGGTAAGRDGSAQGQCGLPA